MKGVAARGPQGACAPGSVLGVPAGAPLRRAPGAGRAIPGDPAVGEGPRTGVGEGSPEGGEGEPGQGAEWEGFLLSVSGVKTKLISSLQNVFNV